LLLISIFKLFQFGSHLNNKKGRQKWQSKLEVMTVTYLMMTSFLVVVSSIYFC